MRKLLSGSVGGLLVSLALHGVAQADSRALLVGVSHYPGLSGRDLVGPANDVRLMTKTLRGLGFESERLHVLSEDSGALPTRANILNGLSALADSAKPGDWVLVYFSGHGAQVPRPPRRSDGPGEARGLDEVFLPRDTQLWNPQTQQVQGAIRDQELGAAVRRILNKGANVWAILDTCHAADMLRKPSRALDWRFVSPEVLNIPMQLWAERFAGSWRRAAEPRGAAPLRSTPVLQGGRTGTVKPGLYVAFFSAQKDEGSLEELLPDPEEPQNLRRFGLFTYKFAQAAQSWGGHLAELARRLERAYQDRPFPSPQFVGALESTFPVSAAP
ncbi:caspase family protein [Paucibacter sp. AS339]|uniref:caspase family protein n=1 Tax=Paucibacter hankyongi TaxID=3133434 RepID=UPI0030A011E7